jgi:hypothetical protein
MLCRGVNDTAMFVDYRWLATAPLSTRFGSFRFAASAVCCSVVG